MMNQLYLLQKALRDRANLEKAKVLAGFFKAGKGEYGEGDRFLGITVPEQRKIVKEFSNLGYSDISELVHSPIHEERLTGLLILVAQYQKMEQERAKIYDFYVNHFSCVNNWDLVDLTASHIVGAQLFDQDRSILQKWAGSSHLWTRRISIIATHYFIRKDQFEDTLKITRLLLHDPHDLIHKAVGWMLREVGKRNQPVEEAFLQHYYRKMPRTMLRYAIERFSEELRQRYLKGQI